MPRPPAKRRRQNSFGKSFALKDKYHGPRIPNQAKAREEHEKKLAKKSVGKRPADSDDSDDLITTWTSGHPGGRRKQEIYASGAVAKGDTPGAWPTKAQRTRAMREDTEEILSRRSRSASRVTSDISDKENGTENAQSKEKASIGVTRVNSQIAGLRTMPNGISHTPQQEMSVLGKIKPRKRQASILQLIDNENNDSSSFLSDDETGFLPDEVSTSPLNPVERPATPSMNGSALLKRKRGSDVPQSQHGAQSPAVSMSLARVQTVLSPPSRSQQRKLSVSQPVQNFDAVMAPPESSGEDSSDEPVPAAKPSRRNLKPSKVVAPSTEQLQSLMPSKKHKLSSGRRPQQNTEFDIPADSDEISEDENDASNFLPGRSRKAQKRPAAKAKAKQTSKGNANGKVRVKTKTKIKDQTKSTRTTSSCTPAPVRFRTPRPLSTSKLKETQAKSPSKQESSNIMQDKPTNTTLPRKTSAAGKKRYGGSRGLRSTAMTGGKENQTQLVSLSDEPSVEPGSPVKRVNASKPKQAETTEMKAWNKKWADIDDFSLDFEEISASTRSSSPMAR